MIGILLKNLPITCFILFYGLGRKYVSVASGGSYCAPRSLTRVLCREVVIVNSEGRTTFFFLNVNFFFMMAKLIVNF